MWNVILLGLVSFFSDISAEMVYPIIPLYLTSVFGATPALIGLIEGIAESLASLLKVFSGYVTDKWGKKNLWARLIGSTIAGQLVDTIIFCTIAFYGIITGWSFINYVLIGVAYKVAVEIILLPITYRVVAIIKRHEADA